MKQETLEEAAENYTIDFATMSAFKLGAKWQQERSYSEEEVLELIQFLSDKEDFKENSSISIFIAEDFLNQFKNK